MKVTNFGPGSLPLPLAGWSSGVTSVNSNFNTEDGGFSATNFVQGITVNGSNMLLRPIANIAAGSNILLSIDVGPFPAQAYPSNTLRIHSTGGAGGSVATDTIWDAKGDLAVGTGSDTASRLAVGANDTVLTADSTQSTGLKWSTVSGASTGLQFMAGPLGVDYSNAPTNPEVLAISGGTLVVSILVTAPMRLTSLFLHNRNTANLRTAEWRLYKYGGTNLDFVTGTDGTFSFTPTVVSDRSSTPSGSPVTLGPGQYWLAIRNTSGAQTFDIGYANTTGTYYNAATLHYTQTLGSALGSTLTTAGWSAGARLHAVRLRANDFGI